ncbi:uncharacterized protein LOC110456279 isoform X2 [Mizuhopecten yessoensis]|uniref:uncharacterized protein LOC110456279 isoform X2 n=1 Tax=Mizuhopecten yessoensis TaxID=6573 RepID=UPI000B45E746|nr:uncharacterized protein LOC110456279 isoform X2 [Mizuhopecten yessoensis]
MSKDVRKKTSSKLSLKKMGRGNSENVTTVTIPVDLDLNETCEFQQPMAPKAASVGPCPRSGKTKRSHHTEHRNGQQKRIKTNKDLSNSEDNVLPEEKSEVREEGCMNSNVHDNTDPGNKMKQEVEEDDTVDRSRCLACGLYFPQVDLNVHIQKCLQSKFNRTTKPVTGRQSKRVDEVKQEADTDEGYFCLFCKKDLSRLNSKLKTQHLNRCMDKDEKRKKDEEKEKLNLERASKAVLSCPMCGKPFRTENARKIHLKKCALTNGIMTDQILKLVRDQEEEHKLKVAAGIIPPEVGKVKTTAGSCTSNTRGRKVKEPKTLFDEDTHLAMAISSSLDDDEKEKEAELIGQTLGSERAAAINIQINKGNRKRKQHKKGDPEGVPLLLALSDEEKNRRRELKVCSIVVPQDEEEELECTPTIRSSELRLQQEVPHLWTRSCLEDKETKIGEDFYVSSLMPPVEVSKAVMGTKIRRMSEIPGRRRSVSTSHQEELVYCKNDGDVMVQKDNFIASTQTAIVLAELAASGEEEELETSVHCSGFCPETTIKIKGSFQSEAGRGLQTAMLGLVNDQSGSDVTIIVQDNQEVYAHTLILNHRCPALLQLKQDSQIVLEVSFDVMLVILKYVYAGHISLCWSNVDKARALSKRLELDELTKICEEVLAQDSTEMDNTLAGHQDNTLAGHQDNHSRLDTIKNRQSDVDRILNNVWGESSEDDDPETCHESSAEASPTKSWRNTTDEEYGDITSPPARTITSPLARTITSPPARTITSPLARTQNTVKNHSGENEYRGKSTLVVKDSGKSPSNNTQCPRACEYGVKGDNSDRNQEELQQEINNFFQDDSFDMTCDIQKDETEDTTTQPLTSKSKNRNIIFEDNEVALFTASESSSSLGSVSPNVSLQDRETDLSGQPSVRDTGMEDSSCYRQTKQIMKEKAKEADIIISSDESEDEINEDQSPINDFDEKNETRQLYPQVQQCKTKLLQNSKSTSRVWDPAINVSIEDDQLVSMGSSPPRSFRQAEENSPIRLSPDLIEDDVAEDSFLLLSSPSKKRKRAARKKNTKVKSPVVVVKSPEKTESFYSDTPVSTPVSNAETSGLDLFGSPSPCNKRRKTDSPRKLRQDASYLDDRTRFSKSSKSLNLSPKSISPRNLTSNELENNSPTFSHSQKHGTRKLFVSEQRFDSNKPDQPFEPCKSKLDPSQELNTGKDVLNLSMGVMSSGQTDRHVDGDVECIGDNLQNIPHGSPIFHAKMKKKWKFTKTNIHNAQTETSPEKMKVLSLNTELTGSSTGGPEHQAVWIEVSPVKLSQENSPVVNRTALDIDQGNSPVVNRTALDIDQDMSIPRDVWDDFDDSGAGFVGTGDISSVTSTSVTPTSVTPKGHYSFSNKDESEAKINSNIHQSPAVQTPNFPRHLEKTPGYLRDTAPTEDFDESFVWGEDNVSLRADREPGGQAKMLFKTPTVCNQQKAAMAKPWKPPSPFTPMPRYDGMNTPQLKRAVNKIGVRPVGKKRMVALLKDVYDKTHQYETDSDCEEDEEEGSGCTKEKDTEADELNSSQESSQSDMVEESFMQGSTDDLVPSQLSQKDDTALSEKLERFFISRTDIHRKTLMYEPLEVDWLKKEITEAGIKCSMQKLLDFLDEMCITFTMKKMRQERNARKGKGRGKLSPSKKGSPKKKTASPSKKGSPTKTKASKQVKGSPQKKGSKGTAMKPIS